MNTEVGPEVLHPSSKMRSPSSSREKLTERPAPNNTSRWREGTLTKPGWMAPSCSNNMAEKGGKETREYEYWSGGKCPKPRGCGWQGERTAPWWSSAARGQRQARQH